jgi:hypothetical protein
VESVVDDDDFEHEVDRCDPAQELFDRCAFVVGRHDEADERRGLAPAGSRMLWLARHEEAARYGSRRGGAGSRGKPLTLASDAA